jgi:hypothetical protein
MDNYFKHYPLVLYGNTSSNTVSVNLLSKIAFRKNLQANYEVFHPYTIQEGDRPDTIAYLYYGDPGYDWLVYYSNNVLDPYFDWYLDSNTFRSYIVDKYGSVADSQKKIKFFRSNYREDDSLIPAGAYTMLSEKQKRFWSPVLNLSGTPYNYDRKKEDVTFETNQVKNLSISIVGNTSFTQDEYVFQQSGGLTVASATLGFSNSSTAVISRVIGNWSTSLNIKGSSSGSNAVVSAINTISTSIGTDIQNYFSAVSYYDYENEINEERKNIKLIDAAYAQSIEKEFKQLLSS